MNKGIKYFRADLVGTRLSDFAYVGVSTPMEVRDLVWAALDRLWGSVDSPHPDIEFSRVSRSEVRDALGRDPVPFKVYFDFMDFSES